MPKVTVLDNYPLIIDADKFGLVWVSNPTPSFEAFLSTGVNLIHREGNGPAGEALFTINKGANSYQLSVRMNDRGNTGNYDSPQDPTVYKQGYSALSGYYTIWTTQNGFINPISGMEWLVNGATVISISGGSHHSEYSTLGVPYHDYNAGKVMETTYPQDLTWYELLRTDDLIDGSELGDVLNGYLGTDVIYGRGGDDIFISAIPTEYDKDDQYFGGAGLDTFWMPVNSTEVMLSKNPISEIITLSSKISNTVTIQSDVEQFQFLDKKVMTSDIQYWGQFSTTGSSGGQPIYTFFNTRDNAFFYTHSKAERDMIISKSYSEDDSPTVEIPQANTRWSHTSAEVITIGVTDEDWPYVYLGASFKSATPGATGAVPVYRFYNENTGHHFFTTSEAEKNDVISKSNAGVWPFNYEGIGFSVYAADPDPNNDIHKPVYRFYNPGEDRHFFGADTTEVELIGIAGGWVSEGIAWWG